MAASAAAPRVVDLFSGAGGLSLGFDAAGAVTTSAVDVDEGAASSLLRNFSRLHPDRPPLVLGGDEANLEDLDLSRIARPGEVDILVGGPPCQGFSRLGRAKLDSLSEEGFEGDPRNDLYRRFLDAARLWRPLAVVMENVPGMLSVAGRNVADDAAEELAGCGYRVRYALLNAVWYGVPQFRERLIFIGLREDLGTEPSMPPATHRSVLPAGYARGPGPTTLVFPFIKHHQVGVGTSGATLPEVTVSDALDDMPSLTAHLEDRSDASVDGSATYRHAPHSSFAALMRDWPGLAEPASVQNHQTRRTPRDYYIFREMLPGDRYPEALGIARHRLGLELRKLEEEGRAPLAGSTEAQELLRRFVPPYPENIFKDKWRKLIPDRPSWTVPAHLSKDAYSHIHHDSEQARSISVREAARLQSFPDAFEIVGNMGDGFRQIGNAVPPVLAWALAAEVMNALNFRSTRPWERLSDPRTVSRRISREYS